MSECTTKTIDDYAIEWGGSQENGVALEWEFFRKFYKGTAVNKAYRVDCPRRYMHSIYRQAYVIAPEGSRLAAFARTKNDDAGSFRWWTVRKDPRRMIAGVDFDLSSAYCGQTVAERLACIAGQSPAALAAIEHAQQRENSPWNRSLIFAAGQLERARDMGLKLENGKFEHLGRTDTLISMLDDFYEARNKCNWAFRFCREYGASPQCAKPLMNHLVEFGGFLKYCSTIYGISADLARRLSKMGKKPLTCESDVLEYLDLVETFWNERANSARGHRAAHALDDYSAELALMPDTSSACEIQEIAC